MQETQVDVLISFADKTKKPQCYGSYKMVQCILLKVVQEPGHFSQYSD